MDFILLDAERIRQIERALIAAGKDENALMAKAGAGVADLIMKRWTPRPVLVLCGPGNNGGDGFVIARLLSDAGWPVRVCLMGAKDALGGAARVAAEAYEGDVEPMAPAALAGAQLVVDALFGIGLARAVEGAAAEMIDAVNAHGAPVVSVDVPSGVNTDTGEMEGTAIAAAVTATFIAKKPGHFVFPGRALSGDVSLVDIGAEPSHIEAARPQCFINDMRLWFTLFPRPSFQTHKYSRGAVAVISGPRFATGAARLAADGAFRAGAGLVKIITPRSAADEVASHITGQMMAVADTGTEIAAVLRDPRLRTVIAGPGAGVHSGTAALVLEMLKGEQTAVLDADALTSFSDAPEPLFDALSADDIITPHVGEFGRLFSGRIEAPEERLSAAKRAAEKAGCIVVLKGPDTVIAAPDGRVVINANAPPDLATAGAGDVLAGFIGGLRAQSMPAFEAACAGVWLHGACAQRVGPGLIAEDLPRALPALYSALFAPKRGETGARPAQ